MPKGLATNVATMPPAAPISGAAVTITRRAQFLRLHTSLRPNRARLGASLLSAEQTQRDAQGILQRVEAAGIDPRMQPGALLARTAPQVIPTFGGQKRLRHEEHQSTEDVRAPQWRRYEERRPELQPASDPECIREATRRAREGAVAAYGLGAALTATAEGKVVTNSEVDTYQYVGQREDKQAERQCAHTILLCACMKDNVHIQFYCVHA